MVVLIPGVSGGFGQVLARAAQAAGHRVYGTSRQPSGGAEAPPWPVLAMDITDPASIEKAVAELVEREGRIDAVVNCVNDMMIGGIEEQTVEEVQALYETNVFGTLRLFQGVLPVLRRQGSGTLVTMSSLGGLLAVPYMSAYTSAKFALEAMTEALYHEVRGTGIDVVIMQPVAMAMDRAATGAHLHTAEHVADDSPTQRMVIRMARDTAASKLTPEQVAARVLEVLAQREKPLRVPLDRAKPLGWVKGLAPQALIDRLIGGLLDGIEVGDQP
ncbi:MAG: SDR family oxidoreductase [Myxococcota bacterium]